jgi:hypothetical protein
MSLEMCRLIVLSVSGSQFRRMDNTDLDKEIEESERWEWELIIDPEKIDRLEEGQGDVVELREPKKVDNVLDLDLLISDEPLQPLRESDDAVEQSDNQCEKVKIQITMREDVSQGLAEANEELPAHCPPTGLDKFQCDHQIGEGQEEEQHPPVRLERETQCSPLLSNGPPSPPIILDPLSPLTVSDTPTILSTLVDEESPHLPSPPPCHLGEGDHTLAFLEENPSPPLSPLPSTPSSVPPPPFPPLSFFFASALAALLFGLLLSALCTGLSLPSSGRLE